MNKKLIAIMFACLTLVIIICASNSTSARIAPPSPSHDQEGTLCVTVESNLHGPEPIVTAVKMPAPASFINIPWYGPANAYVETIPTGFYKVIVRIGLIQLVQYAYIISGFSTWLNFKV